MRSSKFLSKAAGHMLQEGEVELSSYFVRKFQDGKIEEERKAELLGLLQTSTPIKNDQATGNRTPSKASNDVKLECDFPLMCCKQCGSIQNPLEAHYRLRPKIRKKRGARIRQKERPVESDKKTTKMDKNLKNARKYPFVSSKCQNCEHVQKLTCQTPPSVKGDKKPVKPQSNNKAKRRSKILSEKKDVATALPERFISNSKSSRKRKRLKDSPLAKLLSVKNKAQSVSPSLQSFLFNS